MTIPATVLMSVRNAMPYLPLAVESILKQSINDFEFIIVDDHSSDGSREFLKGLSDSRINLLYNRAEGQTKALNQGLSQAQGEWIARMDGDDWSHPDRLAKQLSMAKSQNSILISADFWICDESLSQVAEMRLNTKDPGFFHYVRDRQNPFCHPVMMFRRDAAQAAGGYDENLATAQDYALWRTLLARGQLAHVAEPLLKYRVSRGAVSIARYREQAAGRQRILNPTGNGQSLSAVNADGLYAYRLGFAAWIGGHRAQTIAFMALAIRRGARTGRALAALLLSFLPRRFYLRLTGYAHVYR